ncbi:hypothetical protein HPB51_012069 [Rhipicephalus microplus]|uniref:Ig-like domain-containing protein n=1 Tax=Rhipicephalus microplus TaxID=6941 RepID=A0A9J6EG95_RHIMP|nr:hypothetical protein HPB51_012069 [Rhipicephalus microplus]
MAVARLSAPKSTDLRQEFRTGWLRPLERKHDDRRLRRLGQHPSWPYGNKIASDSFHYECAVLNTSIGLIETRPCEDKHQFVCIRDNELRPVDVSERELSVELTSSQPPILLSRSLADFRLTCRAKLRNGTMLKEPGNHGYAHVWTKNGIFLDTTNSFLQPETVSELNAYTHIDPSKQGRYQCGLKALPSGHTVWSHVITLVFEGGLKVRTPFACF